MQTAQKSQCEQPRGCSMLHLKQCLSRLGASALSKPSTRTRSGLGLTTPGLEIAQRKNVIVERAVATTPPKICSVSRWTEPEERKKSPTPRMNASITKQQYQ